MTRYSFILSLCLAAVVLPRFSACALFAQELAPAPAQPDVEKLPLRMFHVLDDKGELVPVPDLTEEELDELLKLREQIKNAKPTTTISQRHVVGKVNETFCEFDAKLKIIVTESEWTQLPLLLSKSVITAKPEGEGLETLLTFTEAGGYVCWVKPTAKLNGERKEFDLSFPLKCGIEIDGVNRQVSMELPSPPISTLKLTFSGDIGRPTIRPALPFETELVGGKTQVTIHGSRQVALSWRVPQQMQIASAARLEAAADIKYYFSSDTTVVGLEGQVTVKAPIGRFDQFDLQLQSGCQLNFAEDGGYTVERMGAESENRFRISVDPPVSEFVLPIQGECIQTTSDESRVTTLSGITVVGAYRQSGSVLLKADKEVSLSWGVTGRIERTALLPEDRDEPLAVARFDYFAKDFTLTVRPSERSINASVEPSYLALVESDRVRLTAKFKVRLQGGTKYELLVNANGWERGPNFDPTIATLEIVNEEAGVSGNGVLGAGVDEVDDAPKNEVYRITISDEGDGLTELELDLTRRIEAEEEEFSFHLPVVETGRVVPATLVVMAADNVAVSPKFDEFAGILVDTLPPPMDLPKLTQTPLFLRVTYDAADPEFVASFDVRQQALAVDSLAELKISPGSIKVRQTLQTSIYYEPAGILHYLVSADIIKNGSLLIKLGPDVLPWTITDDPALDGRQRIVVDLLGNRLGETKLEVSYAMEMPTVREGLFSIAVPLIEPDDANSTVVDCRLRLNSEIPNVQLESSQWQLSTVSNRNEWSTALPNWNVMLSFPPQQESNRVSTGVRGAWLQTWITQGARQDRAAFRLQTSRQKLVLQMPGYVNLDSLQVAFNGQQVESWSRLEGSTIEVDLPTRDEGTEFTLELWYLCPGEASNWVVQAALPKIVDAPVAQRFYWQMILPSDSYALNFPADLQANVDWQWHRGILVPTAAVQQDEIESWLGASEQPPIPNHTNQYVFSGFSPQHGYQTLVIGRATLLLIVSGGVLLLGLLVMRLEALRHPVALLIMGLLVLFIGIIYPAWAVFTAQLAVLGAACLITSRVITTLAQRRPKPELATADASGSITVARRPAEDSRTQLMPMPVGESSK